MGSRVARHHDWPQLGLRLIYHAWIRNQMFLIDNPGKQTAKQNLQCLVKQKVNPTVHLLMDLANLKSTVTRSMIASAYDTNFMALPL